MIFPTARKFFLWICLLTSVSFLQAQAPIPEPTDELVNDYANLLSRNENQQLTRKLAQYARETSTQIVVFTENSLEGYDPFNRALDIYDKWGIGGSREKSNGVLIYVAKAEQKVRIMTGQGAEGFLPDILADRVIEQIIVPNFKQNRYYRGLDRATSAIMELGQGEYTNDLQGQQGQQQQKRDAKGGIPAILIIGGILLFVVLYSRYGRRGQDDDDDGGYYRGGRYDMDPHRGRRRRRGGGWMIFPFPWFGGGGWSSGGGGGGWGGGDMGGGDWGDFGGFGGGITGGGGAGGEW